VLKNNKRQENQNQLENPINPITKKQNQKTNKNRNLKRKINKSKNNMIYK
jgi:hypothetical protein